MERRTFVQGAFGLVVLAAGGGLAALATSYTAREGRTFVTPEVADAEGMPGPAMAAGIELVAGDEGKVVGVAQGTHLFTVNETGAQLIRLADGSLTIDELAYAIDEPVLPADVASFFVSLGQAGYLANTVLVNLLEIPS